MLLFPILMQGIIPFASLHSKLNDEPGNPGCPPDDRMLLWVGRNDKPNAANLLCDDLQSDCVRPDETGEEIGGGVSTKIKQGKGIMKN